MATQEIKEFIQVAQQSWDLFFSSLNFAFNIVYLPLLEASLGPLSYVYEAQWLIRLWDKARVFM